MRVTGRLEFCVENGDGPLIVELGTRNRRLKPGRGSVSEIVEDQTDNLNRRDF